MMERAVEIFVLINLLVIGISHLIQPGVWIEFFAMLKSHGKAAAFTNGFISLTFGSIIVAFHWVWEGVVPTIVTCLGIAQVIKSLVAFALPELALKSMQQRMATKSIGYQIGGVLFLLLAGVLMRHLWFV